MQTSTTPEAAAEPAQAPSLPKSLVLVGLMGVGKTTVGRRVARALNLPFMDADAEIEAAAGRTIADIFAERGEAEFRAGERRVIARLLDSEPVVLATGGGAFLNPETRALIRARALSVWLKADIEVLVKRVSRRDTRPLLHGKDPREVLERLAAERYPIYAEADLVVETSNSPHDAAVHAVLRALEQAGLQRA